jgi:hypothetical protein
MGDISEVSILSAHAVNHKQGGNDSIRLDELATPLDNTVLNATNARHGLLPKLSNNAAQYLNGVGAFAAIPAGSVPAHASTHKSGGSDQIKLDELLSPDDNLLLNASLTKHGLLPKLGGGTVNFLRADGSWGAPSGLGTDSPPYVYDSYPVSYNITVGGSISSDGKWRNLYLGSRPDQPADVGQAGVRVPAAPTNGFARVFYEYPYLATYTVTTSPPTSSTMCLTNTGNFTDIDVTLYMRLVDQRRQVPKAWEGPWIFFRFNTADGTNFHHYYLVLKTDGTVEFGRKDNTTHAEEQTFLDTSPTYTYALNTWTKVRIRAEGNLFNIWINDVHKIVDLLDDGTVGSHYDGSGPIALLPPSLAMYQGLIGIYNEDAEVEFGPITITELGSASSSNAVITYSDAGTGAGSIPIILTKETTDLPFKGIRPGSAYVTVTDTTASDDISIDVANVAKTNVINKITVNDPQPLTFYRPINTVGTGAGPYWNYQNSSSAEVTYGLSYVAIEVNTAGAHRGDYYIQLAVAAVLAIRFRVYTSGNGGIIFGNNMRIQIDETGQTGAHAFTLPDANSLLIGTDVTDVDLADGKDIGFGTSTGTKLGTGPTQKMGFYGVTPVVQPAANADTSGATLPNLEIEVNQLKALLRSVGLLAT